MQGPTLPSTPKKEQKPPTSPPPCQSAVCTEQLPFTPELRMPRGMQQQLRDIGVAPRQSVRVPVPNPQYFNADNVAQRGGRLGNAELLAAAYVGRDPASYAEAMGSTNVDSWEEACKYEIATLDKNKTWELVDLSAGRKAVKLKWVFKHKADGRYHARLVAKGFTQIPGLDYDETFSPVACFESLRLLLALAVLEDWEVHQLDIKSAFLNGVLDEEIYMEQPQGFIITGKETRVCHLKKAIYGLKQASCAWNSNIHAALTELGFKWTVANAGIYVMHQQEGDGPLYIILYVDDIIILGASLEAVKELKVNLAKHYEISDLGEIESYLGICITRDQQSKHLTIDQSGYIKDVLVCFGMADANPHNTPLPAGADVHLVKYDLQASVSDIKHYQSLIGSLLYIQIGTRPEISCDVSCLVQYAANPSPNHLHLAQYVLSYLVGTTDVCLCYDGAIGEGLYGYMDSSLADQADDCHSTSGYVFLLANS